MTRVLTEEEKAARRQRDRERCRAYYQANKERLKEKARAGYRADKAGHQEKARARYRENVERMRAYARAYYRAHAEQRRAHQRAVRAARRREYRCVKCGEPLPFHVRVYRKTVCAACRKRDREAAAGRRAAALRAALEAHGTPVCPRCGGTNIGRLSRPKGDKRFFCRDCRARRHRGVAPRRPGPNPYPCPHCQGCCRKHGFSQAGEQTFLCRVCGRCNTMLRPNPRPSGPLRHAFTLVIGLRASRRLDEICEARGWSMAAAVREILRKYGGACPTAVITRQENEALGITTWQRRPLAPGEPAPWRYADASLPNASSAASKKMWEEKKRLELYGKLMPRRVCVVRTLRVSLDDAAWEGLHRVMEARQMTHQEAARWMIVQEPIQEYAGLSRRED